MHFRLKHVLNPLKLCFDGEVALTFAYCDEPKTRVTIRPLTAEEAEEHDKKAKDGKALMCIAYTEMDPPSDILAIFERLANNLMPERFKKPKRKGDSPGKDPLDFIDDEGRFQPGKMPPASLLSEQFQAFELNLLHELSDAIKQTVKIIRWRYSINSEHRTTRFTLGLAWSIDGHDWHVMPQGKISVLGGHIELNLPNSINQPQIESLIKSETREPLGHELFLEAWNNRTSDPRSALVTGISAAEVGLKQCIGTLVPDAKWLVNNIPSPPISDIIKYGLEKLPAKLKIQERVLPPPKSIRRAIYDGIKERNTTTHAGHSLLKDAELAELLLSVRDLLYLLDSYCGHEWAMDNIRLATRQEMIKEFGLKMGE